MFAVEVRTIDGAPTAIGSAGPYTLVVDRPAGGGGGGLGFNGGQLLYLAVAGCVSNDLFREADAAGLTLRRVRVSVHGDFAGDPPVSTSIGYDVEIEGDAPRGTAARAGRARRTGSPRSRTRCAARPTSG